MSLFPASATSGTSYWVGETLYQYNGANNEWNPKYELTPVHHWRLNEAVGSNIVSDSGSNPIAGSSTMIVYGSSGKVSTCGTFGTSTSCVMLGLSADYSMTAAFTIMNWIFPQYAMSTTSYNNFIRNAGDIYAFEIHVGTYCIEVQNGTKNFGTAPLFNQWQHVAWVHSAQQYDYLYLNGVLASSILSATGQPVNAATLTIGPVNYCNLEDVRIYNRALTTQEISAIYERGRGTYSQSLINGWPTVKPPIHHWRLNEKSGNVVNDKGSNPVVANNYGALVGQSGKIGNSYSFTGTSSRIECGSLTGSECTTKVSISLWCNINSVPSYNVLANKPQVSTAWNANYGLIMVSGIPRFYINAWNGNYVQTGLSQNTWTHLVGTYDMSNIKLYANGVLMTSTAYTTSITIDNYHFMIGASNAGTYTTYGYLEDVRLYDYALSETEIKNIYNNGKGTYL